MKPASDRLEIRGDLKSKWLGRSAGCLMRLWCRTLRIRAVDVGGYGLTDEPSPPVIFMLWHNRILAAPAAWKPFGRRRRLAVLTSASRDGTVLAEAVGSFGFAAVRGSSSRRAVAAWIGLKRALEAGMDVCVTPDGPRGPCYTFHPGIVKLAAATGARLVPVHVRYQRAWKLKSWDRFRIPLPFSRVEVIFDKALEIPAAAGEAAFQAEVERAREALLAGVEDRDFFTS